MVSPFVTLISHPFFGSANRSWELSPIVLIPLSDRQCNLLDDQLVDVLLDSAAGGVNTVEREGVSAVPRGAAEGELWMRLLAGKANGHPTVLFFCFNGELFFCNQRKRRWSVPGDSGCS